VLKHLRTAGIALLFMGGAMAHLQQLPAFSQGGPRPAPVSSSELEHYKHARTLMDWTPAQVRNSSFLRGVRISTSQNELQTVLLRAGRSVTALIDSFPQISCEEEVTFDASRLDPRKTYQMLHYPTVDRKFRYIVLPMAGEGLSEFQEYRTDPRGNPIDPSKPEGFYMLTSDFASAALYLRASDQPITHFRYFGTQTIRNQACHIVGFAQDPTQVRRVGEAVIDGKRSAILVQGLAWIDSSSFQILRMKTWLLAPRRDIGLNSEVSTVDFAPVKPAGSETALWLPHDVTVEIDHDGVELKNTHHYSNFKLFRVESKIK
jgi:hypothetical protein